MTSSRLEAFSDGVLAIIITVMVLGLAVPKGASWTDLVHTSGLGLLTYVLSFVYIGIYWNNHHHLFQLRPVVDGAVLWANLHLLLWLSLYPFTTAWLTQTRVAEVPTVVYGLNLLGAAIAYMVLQQTIAHRPGGARIRAAFGRDLKGVISPILYLIGIGLAFVQPWIGLVPFVAVAVIWLVPDRRVERYLNAQGPLGEAADDEEDPA
ncbi:TMEM175 family protein [Microbacterium sp. ASV81]|uniref:TMEM175 family protein n=1 Tax=Microbacterium capsulatum TaxID=3041921 RepID=A0ABU0XD66_9MICO|nr:TMEM175 family protein [Microbacterium sp. ASV81]MDQ4213054.1 TMEM175 family protein [Microbacterium sp. ASV81]